MTEKALTIMTERPDKSKPPTLGWAHRAKGEPKTVSAFLDGIERIAPNMRGDRFLNVGCGEGTLLLVCPINFPRFMGFERGPLRLFGSSILVKYERFAGTTCRREECLLKL
jgi:hypothetical protein